VKLAVPVALQNVLTSSFQLVDTLMVSQLGDVTLSAVGMAAQWGWLCGLLGFGLCSGMSVFISQYWGVKDLKGIRRVMGIGLMLAMFVSLGFLAVALAAPTWVLGLFNQDPAVVETGCRYLRIVCFSYPAVALTYLLSNVLRGTLCLYRHDHRQRLCGLWPDLRRVRPAAARRRGRGHRNVHFVLAGAGADSDLLCV